MREEKVNYKRVILGSGLVFFGVGLFVVGIFISDEMSAALGTAITISAKSFA